jgi:hypothetical protein
MARKQRQASVTRRFHRTLGAGAAGFILFMVLSGLLINHSNDLGMSQRHVSQSFLLSWYGIDAPESIHSFSTGQDWLSFAGSQLYFNGNPVSAISNGVGAVSGGEMMIAAGSEEFLLLDTDGNLIERLSWETSGSGAIESIGVLGDGSVVIKSEDQLWMADKDLLGWQPAQDPLVELTWSSPEPTPEELHQVINKHYRGDGVSMERLLLDLHSGRIFGPLGILVYDLLALAVGFLAISGLVVWLRARRNGNGNGKR